MKHRRELHRSIRGSGRAGGFSLVEMMIAMTLGLMMLAGVLTLFGTSARTGRTTEASSAMQTSGRYAISVLRFELLHTGYDSFNGFEAVEVPGVVNVTGDCVVGFASNLGQRLWATDDRNPFAGTCVPSASYLTGDVVAFRRASLAPPAALAADRLNVRIAFEGASVFQGSTPPANGFAPVADHQMEAIVYFVSPFTVSADESPRVPALYRVRLGAGPSMGAPELVASGVEDFQIELGVRDAAGTISFVDPDTVAPAAVTAATTGSTAWNFVETARVHLLVRSEKPEPGYSPGGRTYQLGSKTVTVNDAFRRDVYTTVVQLRNS